MRRRSRPQPRPAGARPNFQRYLFYAALVVLSLVFPAALTLVGRRPPPSSQQAGGDPPGDVMWPTVPGVAAIPADEPVSPRIWQGMAEGIPSTPRSAKDIHVVFSTDCSPYQNYQAIMLFNSAEVRRYSSTTCDRAVRNTCVGPLVSCLLSGQWAPVCPQLPPYSYHITD